MADEGAFPSDDQIAESLNESFDALIEMAEATKRQVDRRDLRALYLGVGGLRTTIEGLEEIVSVLYARSGGAEEEMGEMEEHE